MPINALFGTVIRVAPCGRKTRFEVSDYKVAEYLHSLQAHGYKYQVVHSVKTDCAACEA